VKNRIYTNALVLLVIAMVICGCSRSNSVGQDKSKARNLLDQVYAGSLSPIQGELEPSFQKGNPDRLTSGASAALRQQFGAIRDLKFQSVENQISSALAIWTVTAERGNFEMKIAYNSGGKVTGLWFRASSSQEWTPSFILGADYLKPGVAAEYGPNLMKGRR